MYEFRSYEFQDTNNYKDLLKLIFFCKYNAHKQVIFKQMSFYVYVGFYSIDCVYMYSFMCVVFYIVYFNISSLSILGNKMRLTA